MRYLQNINGHDDLVKLNDRERAELCDEIRDFLVQNISKTGGHLASNLGVVELMVAIETVFQTQKDRLVFDVGHQCYVHKLLTGRQSEFKELRKFGGIAGFPKPSESDSDAFVAGHASSSVSIALGMARARTLQKEQYQVIALMGDGAATGGMAFEGLNNAAVSREPIVIILNDNEMSIARNVGGIAKHLSKLRSSDEYLRLKQLYRHLMTKLPCGKVIYSFTSRIKNRLKRIVLPSTIFENMGLTYLGPVDGHNLPDLISLLTSARDLHAPVLVHVTTKKGKGYLPAEIDPALFHGIGKFDPKSGEPICQTVPSFSDCFGETMIELAKQNPGVCAITAAMPGGTGLAKFQKVFPKRTFDVGIAEEHAVSMAGGLAKQGMTPVVAIYSTFLQRSFDQIMQDVAMLHLHVVFAIDRAGLVGEDGETHHGIYDVGFLRQMPGMTVLCPVNFAELKAMLNWAVNQYNGPGAIRYPRGGEHAVCESAWPPDAQNDVPQIVQPMRSGTDIAIISYGTVVSNALEAADILRDDGISAAVYRLLCVDPIPYEELLSRISGFGRIVIVEETGHNSGIGQDLICRIAGAMPGCRADCIDLGDSFVTHGKTEILYKCYGLDGDSIADFVRRTSNHES